MKVQVPNDAQWQQKRQQRWDEVWWDSLTVHGCEQTKAQKETIAAQKQWYLHGDLEPLMSLPSHLDRQDALHLLNVPATTTFLALLYPRSLKYALPLELGNAVYIFKLNTPRL